MSTRAEDHYLSTSPKPNGPAWWNEKTGEEWRRYWCSNPNHPKCRQSIPARTGRKRPVRK